MYVGKASSGMKLSLAQHMGASKLRGAAFTRLHLPANKLLKRLGNFQWDGDGPEQEAVQPSRSCQFKIRLFHLKARGE